MAWPIVAAAGLAALGSLGAGYLGYKGQKKANQTNYNMMRENMAWQQQNSDTAMQRQMQDLQKAGLNPLLAARLGGASTPSAMLAQMQNESGGLAHAIESGSSSAIAVAKAKGEIQNIAEQNLSLRSNRDVQAHQNLLTDAQVQQTMANSALSLAQAKNTAADTLYKLEQTGAVKAQSAKNKMTEPLFEVGGNVAQGLANNAAAFKELFVHAGNQHIHRNVIAGEAGKYVGGAIANSAKRFHKFMMSAKR